MFKLFYLNKIKIILTGLTFSKYLFWCAFLYFQGNAIQQAIEKNEFLKELILALIGFGLSKLVMMLTELLSAFVTSYYENEEINRQWKGQFPLQLFHDLENKDNLICLLYFDYLPTLFSLECLNIINITTIFSILSIILCLVIYTQFYFGLLSLFIIFLLSFLSKNIGLKQIDDYQSKRNESKSLIYQWINEYFCGYREVAFNWRGQLKDWSQGQYQNLYHYNRKILFIHLTRDILSQLLIELPFIINTCMVIGGVYFHYLSVTQMFIWIGLSQFVIQSSNSYLEFKLNKVKKNNLLSKINEIFVTFGSRHLPENNDDGVERIKERYHSLIEVSLQDGTVNQLGLIPSLYSVQGKNGAGKTTLLNIILDYERVWTVPNKESLNKLLINLSSQNLRVIEKNSIIFNDLSSFKNQILGPAIFDFKDWKDLLNKKMGRVLTYDLISALEDLLKEIESKFYQRKDKRFSSGEKVVISFFRTIASWNSTVSLVIIDECTAFLDFQIKDLFMRCINQLAKEVAIYLCSHEAEFSGVKFLN